LTKEEFMQQYVLNRVRADIQTIQVSLMVMDAEQAWNMIKTRSK